MKILRLMLIVGLLTGCTIKNHAIRGAVNGAIGGPVLMLNVNNHDGYLDDQDPTNVGGNFAHIWMSIGFCGSGNPILCGAWLGSNAIFGAVMTHHHFKKLEDWKKNHPGEKRGYRYP